MITQTYVVHSVGSDVFRPFERYDDAVLRANEVLGDGTAERADIFIVVDARNNHAARQALVAGNATLHESHCPKGSDLTVIEERHRAWEEARERGHEAVRKFFGLYQ